MAAHAHVSTFNMPTQARANRSFMRRLLDAIMDSRRRAAEQFLAEYDRAHKDDRKGVVVARNTSRKYQRMSPED
jgi:ribosomal protein S20